VLAPCALLAASGVKPMCTAVPLVIDMVYDSWHLILMQLCVPSSSDIVCLAKGLHYST
jgi:hypothetical protein